MAVLKMALARGTRPEAEITRLSGPSGPFSKKTANLQDFQKLWNAVKFLGHFTKSNQQHKQRLKL
jgi:hypothetical protein